MATPNLSEITTTTIRNRSRKLADNVTDNNALLARLKMRGNMRSVDGGETILQELEYDENSTYKRYTGYEVLDIRPSDVFTAAEFAWKQVAVAVTIAGLERLKNSGKEKMIDLLSSRVKNAEKTMMNGMSEDIYSDGTADGGKQIGGLALLVATSTSSGTVGGINRATWEFWRNLARTGSHSSIKTEMQEAWVRLCRGRDKPDLIIAGNDAYQNYWAALQDQQRFTDPKMGQMGFQNLKFNSAEVVLDGGVGGNQNTNTMHFLNTDYIHYRPHKDRNMVPLEPDRFATNQDAMVKLIAWAGNMTVSNCMLQGVLTLS